MVTRTFLLLVSCLFASCAVPTQVIVHFDADAETLEGASAIRISVASSLDTLGQSIELSFDDERFDGFPIEQPISPFDDDAERRFDVVGELLDSGGHVLMSQRAAGPFFSGERREVWLRFDRACVSAECALGEVCIAGECAPPCVIPQNDAPTRTPAVACP